MISCVRVINVWLMFSEQKRFLIMEIIHIERVLLSFLSEILSPQNSGFIRVFSLVPDCRQIVQSLLRKINIDQKGCKTKLNRLIVLLVS